MHYYIYMPGLAKRTACTLCTRAYKRRALPTDVLGSYLGVVAGAPYETPVQDQDDL